MKEVRIGLIGTGYIGKAHAIAYAQAPTVFNLRGRLVREMVAEVTPELAAARAQAFGFNRSTGDWRSVTANTSTPKSRWRSTPMTRVKWSTPQSGQG